MKTEAITKTIEKIDNNFFAQKICANKIEDLRDQLKNINSVWAFLYSEKDIKEKIKSQIKLLRRLKSMNAANINKLSELNKTR